MQVCKGNLSSVSKNKLKTKSGLVFDLILWCVLIVRWNTFICFDSSLANFVCSLQYLSFYHLGPPPPPKIDMLAMQKNPPNNVVMWAHKDKTREVCTTILNHLASFIHPVNLRILNTTPKKSLSSTLWKWSILVMTGRVEKVSWTPCLKLERNFTILVWGKFRGLS